MEYLSLWLFFRSRFFLTQGFRKYISSIRNNLLETCMYNIKSHIFFRPIPIRQRKYCVRLCKKNGTTYNYLLSSYIVRVQSLKIKSFNSIFVQLAFSAQGITVYNCCTGQRNPISWKQFVDFSFESMRENPLSHITWYPDGKCRSNPVTNALCVFFLHRLPAHVLDLFSLLTGKKPL